MTFLPLLVCALLSVVVSTSAQERTAGSSMETQMTWSALSNRIGSAEVKVTGVGVRVDQIAICGAKGFVYAPGKPGADAEGCKQPAGSADVVNILNCNRSGKLWNGSACIDASVSTLTNMLGCNKQGQLFNGSGCVGTVKPQLNVQFVSAMVCQKGGVVTNTVTCPAGTQVIACSGTTGDQDENGEGSIIKPHGNGCIISVQKMYCGKNDTEIQQGWVHASCARID